MTSITMEVSSIIPTILHFLQLDLYYSKVDLHYKTWRPLYVPKLFRIKHNKGISVDNRGPLCRSSESDHHVSWPMMNPIKKNARANTESFQAVSIRLFFSRSSSVSSNLKYLEVVRIDQWNRSMALSLSSLNIKTKHSIQYLPLSVCVCGCAWLFGCPCGTWLWSLMFSH